MSVQLPSVPGPSTVPACMAAAARYVEREYGETGYVVQVEASGGSQGRAVFRVRHFDGSEFRVMADRYENAWRLPDIEDLSEAVRVGMAEETERREAAFARIDASLS